jgi:urease accessory protein
MKTAKALFAVVMGTAATAPTAALAHLDPVAHGSFAAGFTHPLFGLDHVLAMVAVGLWAALMGGRVLWQVPLAFVAVMIVGFAAALLGMPLPFVEPAILASTVVIGLFVALALSLPAGPAMALVGFFALFHGHAHGGEMGEAGMLAYAAGFAVATALLHAAGVVAGIAVAGSLGGKTGVVLTRSAGAATALAGIWLAVSG